MGMVARMLAEHPQLSEQPLVECRLALMNAFRAVAVALELGELVAQLRLDTASVVAALVYRLVRTERVSKTELVTRVGDDDGTGVQRGGHGDTGCSKCLTRQCLQKSSRRVENVKRMLASALMMCVSR